MFEVRGKRKRRSASAQSINEQHVKRGRPLKRAEEYSVSKPHANARLREWRQENQVNLPTSAASRSHLEQLPNELIQHIFFQCFEINLPRTSVQLAQALSNESTYHALILFAYFDDDNEHPVESKFFLPARYHSLELEDKIRLQRDILSCRWCTLERIARCLPVLSRLTMLQAWHAERDRERLLLEQFDADPQTMTVSIACNDDLEKLAPLPALEDSDAMARHFLVIKELGGRSIFERLKMFESYLPHITTWHSVLAPEGTEDNITIWKTIPEHGETSVLAARVLPGWLISGRPWTQGKLDLLQVLRQGLMFIRQDYVLEISAPELFKGMASAIEEKNITALLTLLDLHNDVFRKEESPQNLTLTLPTHHPLPAYLFHLATKVGVQSSDIMWLLIRAGADSIPKDDDVLTAWAVRRQVHGDEVADWLLKHMSGTADYQIGTCTHFLEHGCLSTEASEQGFPPARARFAQLLGYLDARRALPPTNMTGGPCG